LFQAVLLRDLISAAGAWLTLRPPRGEMPSRSGRPLRRIALAVVSLALVALWRQPGSVASVDAKDVLRYPVGLRHSVTADNGQFSVHGISQGEDQWALALSEKGGLAAPSPLAVVQKLKGATRYAVSYDTDKFSFKPRLAAGVEGIRFSATGSEGDKLESADWALRVRGQNGNHFSATTDNGELVYEGSYTHEEPLAEGLSALYAVDMKRRAGSELPWGGPNWIRHGVGLRYASELGEFKANVHQPSPDGPHDGLEFEAIYSGDLAGPPGSPSYSLVASRAMGDSVAYKGRVRLQGPEGLSAGLSVGLKDGKSNVTGFTDLSTSRAVADGLELSASTRVVASPGAVDLRPLDFRATADLSALAPGYLGQGSEVSASARYKLGEERPQLSASATLKPEPLGPLKLSASGRVTDGGLTGSVAAAARVMDVDATYTASKTGKGTRHVGQAVFPAEAATDKGGQPLPQAYARFTQSSEDHDGKPRLQVGMMYDFNAHGTRFTGQSNLYDNGDQLVDEAGRPWPSVMYNQAKNTADVLRKRIGGDSAEGTQWLRKSF